MGKNRRNRTRGCDWFSANWWQSANVNNRIYQKNLNWIISLAQNRFRWVGLPDTCNVRFLEQALLTNGMATICHDKNAPDIWLSLMVAFQDVPNMYGDPTAWTGRGINGQTEIPVNWDNGAIIYDNMSQLPKWDAFQLLARKLTHYEMVENANLAHQMTPYLITAPQEKKLELTNFYKQLSGGEPAILGDDSLRETIHVEAINTHVPFIGAELTSGKQTVINEVYRLLGIEHLAFEKRERLTESESTQNNAPVSLILLDSLKARRMACDYLNKKFNLNIQVVFNKDIESFNWNFENDLQMQEEVEK